MKIKISKEFMYVFAILLIAFAVSMVSSTNFGVSMIVAPAFIVSEKVSFLTFGLAEYLVQGILFVIFCLCMKKIKLIFFASFLTSLIYGAVLDFWRVVIPHFNPEITEPGSLSMWLRIVYFVLGMVLTSLAVAMFFKTYMCPQVYDYFVKEVSKKYNITLTKFKTCFDFSMLVLAVVLTLVLFRKFVGVGVGTLIMTVCNGILIGFFSKFIDKHVELYSRFPKFEKKFEV